MTPSAFPEHCMPVPMIGKDLQPHRMIIAPEEYEFAAGEDPPFEVLLIARCLHILPGASLAALPDQGPHLSGRRERWGSRCPSRSRLPQADWATRYRDRDVLTHGLRVNKLSPARRTFRRCADSGPADRWASRVSVALRKL